MFVSNVIKLLLPDNSLFCFRRFIRLPCLSALIAICLVLVTYTPAAYATPPEISGTYTGQISGTEDCPPLGLGGTDGPFSATLNFTINQSGGDFTGSGTFSGEDSGTIQIVNGMVDDAGNVSGLLDIQSDVPQQGSFMGTFSNNTLSLTFDFFDLGPPNCVFIASGTFTRSGSGLVINPEITPSNVLTTPLLLNTQVKAITSDLGNRIGDVLKGFGSGPRKTASGFMFQESGLNAGDGMMNYGIWGSYSYSDFDNDFISTAFDGHRHNVLAGIDISPWDNTVLGIAFGYETSDIDTRFNRGNQESDGFTIAPYIGYLLTDNWSVDAAVGYSSVDFDQYRTDPATGARITSSPDADRWFGTLNVNGFTSWNNWLFGGRIGLLHARNIQESFVESNGAVTNKFTSELGQWNVGGDVAYSFEQFEPFARLVYERDFSMTEITVVGGGPQPSNDRDNFVFGAGIRYFSARGITGNLEWNKRFDRDDFNEDTFSLTVRMDF